MDRPRDSAVHAARENYAAYTAERERADTAEAALARVRRLNRTNRDRAYYHRDRADTLIKARNALRDATARRIAYDAGIESAPACRTCAVVLDAAIAAEEDLSAATANAALGAAAHRTDAEAALDSDPEEGQQ